MLEMKLKLLNFIRRFPHGNTFLYSQTILITTLIINNNNKLTNQSKYYKDILQNTGEKEEKNYPLYLTAACQSQTADLPLSYIDDKPHSRIQKSTGFARSPKK